MKSDLAASRPGNLYIAVDVGGTTVKLGLYQAAEQFRAEDGGYRCPELLDRAVIPTRIEDEGAEIVPDIVSAMQRLASAGSIPLADLAGVGIGVPGPVQPVNEKGFPIDGCVNLNWTGIHYIDREIQALCGVRRFSVMNDANAAALGELYFGTDAPDSAPASSAVMITIGTGIGGGIIQDGRVVPGFFGAAGEVGHMPVSPGGAFIQMLHEANPGLLLKSDLEYYASASGIARMAKAAVRAAAEGAPLPASPFGEDWEPEARNVFDAAKNGDALAIAVVDFFFETLGQGLASIASVVDPQLFIIGGGVSAAGDYLLEGLQESYRRQVFHASRGAAFRLARLGNDAGLLGTLVPLLQDRV